MDRHADRDAIRVATRHGSAPTDFLGPFASILGRWIDAKGGASDDDQSNASNGGGSDAGGPCGMTVLVGRAVPGGGRKDLGTVE